VETASGAARAVGAGIRTVLSPAGLRGVAVEAAWVTTHLATYPLGILQERVEGGSGRTRLDHLTPEQRGLLVGDVEAAGTPIIMVHGLVDNRSIFAVLGRGLRKRGFDRVLTMNHSPLTGGVRSSARALAHLVEEACELSGYERVHVVGHSMGGLIARYYAQLLGGDERVHTLITMGTPHSGTLPAALLPVPLVRDLRPDSEVLRELAEPAPDCRTRMVAYWSDLDQLVVPQRNARITHPDLRARNGRVRGVGHMSLPVDSRVVHGISTTLAQLDPAGG